MEVEPELNACLVPKIIIQPLIENSILHGFKDMKSGGEIQLTARINGDWLHIRVEDNGQGLVPEKLLQSMMHQTVSKHGYALRNIYTRLQLYYGTEQRMEITTNAWSGAQIDLWLPRYETEEDFHGPTN